MSDPKSGIAVAAAIARLENRLDKLPAIRASCLPWVERIAPRLNLGGFFPIFEIPRWVQHVLSGEVDESLDSELTYSTLNGYLFIRLIDDVMDEQNPGARSSLLALGLFDLEFQRIYRYWFDADHPFWTAFDQEWITSLELTAQDAETFIDTPEAFELIAAKKLSAIRIPVTAVCHKLGNADAISSWLQFCDLFSRFHQFADDLTDWHNDFHAGRNSWLLAEAQKNRRSGESVSSWILREGQDWALGTLDEWSGELVETCRKIGSPQAEKHVESFNRNMQQKWEEMKPVFRRLVALANEVDVT